MTTDEPSRGNKFDPRLLPPLIAPSRTAFLVIDAQEDFVSPTGAAASWGADLGACGPALGRVENLIVAARNAGATVAFARVVTRPETDSDALKSLHGHKGSPAQSLAICRAGTRGADYYRVAPRTGDIEIEKTLYSSFAGTNLDEKLRARGIDTLVVAGFTTECCVDCTVRDAFHRDYNVFVVTDACAAYERALHESTLRALAMHCALLTDTEAVLRAWS